MNNREGYLLFINLIIGFYENKLLASFYFPDPLAGICMGAVRIL
jgi:hypothetical protein